MFFERDLSKTVQKGSKRGPKMAKKGLFLAKKGSKTVNSMKKTEKNVFQKKRCWTSKMVVSPKNSEKTGENPVQKGVDPKITHIWTLYDPLFDHPDFQILANLPKFAKIS